ncbi:MAG TPA: ABC transporter ATP-binding protein [Candidatus Kapabacteria bacterium]|nr:ABC transporter ATP-binding protein [Candidatus Kapabacteria bacterium]
MIKFDKVSKIYNKLKVLNEVDLVINTGESIAVLGPNGSGKSTLIKSIVGLVKPESGNIHIDNIDIFKDVNYRNNIGYMPQIGRYPDNLTAKEIIHLILKLRNNPDIKYPEELIEQFELNSHINKKMNSLSGGTRQKVSVVLTFMFQPKILILDEPTSGLDPYMAMKFIELVKERNKSGSTIILVSHTLAEIEEIGNRIVYLNEGFKVIDDEVDNLMKNTNTTDVNTAILSKMKDFQNEIR